VYSIGNEGVTSLSQNFFSPTAILNLGPPILQPYPLLLARRIEVGKTVKDYPLVMSEISTGLSRRAYEHILRSGEYFEGALTSQVLPRSVLVGFLKRKGPRWCYFNAQMLTLLSPIWGIEYADNGVFIGAHAWNLYQGRVVDVTWEGLPEEFADLPEMRDLKSFQYFGVRIPYDFVRRNNPIRERSIEPLIFKYIGLY